MDPALVPWIAAPLAGALIGWLTNALAVRMLFRPHQPRRILGLRFHGLIARRQADLARSIGAVVGDHLLRAEDVLPSLHGEHAAEAIDRVLAEAIAPKVQELRSLPLVGGFLTDERVADLRKGLVDGLLKDGALDRLLEDLLQGGVDVHAIVEERVASFPVARLEELVLEVARRELRSIEAWGAVLGALVGLIQAALLGAVAPV